VMGHGVRAAMVAAILRTLVEDSREYATDPAKLLRELNRGISAILKHVQLPIFASACYLVADVSRGELHYANAGHPTPLCVHREPQTAEPLPFTAAKRDPVLGIFANADYHSASCTLCAGDTVLLFTDGLFEVQGADAQYYDQSRLLSSVRQRVGLRADELCKELVDDVQQFAGKGSFVDDVCLIAMEIDHLLRD
jgi:serine phosphatase RsbU (regulator of sigma subunit)